MRDWNVKPTRMKTAFVLTMLLAAGCASKPATPWAEFDRRLDEYAELIDKKIEDPDRARNLKAVLVGVGQEYDRRGQVIRDKQRELKEAARKYDTTDAELETIFADLRREVLDLRKVVHDGHFELRGLVTEAEWNGIVNRRRRILGIF